MEYFFRRKTPDELLDWEAFSAKIAQLGTFFSFAGSPEVVIMLIVLRSSNENNLEIMIATKTAMSSSTAGALSRLTWFADFTRTARAHREVLVEIESTASANCYYLNEI